MSNDTTNERLPSTEDTDTEGTLWQKLLDGKGGVLLLGAGLFFILCNVVVFFGLDTRPNAWLCYLDMHYWSGYLSIALWITAVWLVAESTDIVEDYLPLIRVSMVICILLVLFFALRNFLNVTYEDHSLWLDAVIVVAVCCAVRSAWLLYDYRYGEESIDLEEAQWFWGLSGFPLVGLAVFGILSIITVTVPIHAGIDSFVTISLFSHCQQGLRDLMRDGYGPMPIQALGFLIVTASIAFVYVAGKWAFILASRMRED